MLLNQTVKEGKGGKDEDDHNNKSDQSDHLSTEGGVAQMVERSLSMREVPGSIPGASKNHFKSHHF